VSKEAAPPTIQYAPEIPLDVAFFYAPSLFIAEEKYSEKPDENRETTDAKLNETVVIWSNPKRKLLQKIKSLCESKIP